VTDRDEAALHTDPRRLAASSVADAHAVHAVLIAQHLVELVPQVHRHLAFGRARHQLVDQDRLGPEAVAPVDQVHPAREIGQVQGLLDRGVAPPTTHTSCPRKKNPSQVAQPETPLPMKVRSDGSPRYLAEAPVAMINASHVYAPMSPTR